MSETVTGLQINLSDERHVFVAERHDAFLIQFKNAQGQITRLKLSHDAAEALHCLLGGQFEGEELIRGFVKHILMKQENDSLDSVWTVVSPETVEHLLSAEGGFL